MTEAPCPSPVRRRYHAVFVSPHLDDAVFSCGGRIAQLVKEGPVLVLNLFTRYLSDLKIHGAVMGEQRHQEERDAASFLGFESRSLDELDAPFRREAYRKLGNLFRPPCQQDLDWLQSLRARLFDILSEIDFDEIYVPLGIGWHVDHVLTYLAFETWVERNKLLYYEDAPYCDIPHATRYRLNDIASYSIEPGDASLQPINELLAWRQAASAYVNTALMKNLQPWLVRQAAVPVVGFYLWRLMVWHRQHANRTDKRPLGAIVCPIAAQLEHKVDAMVLYASQFREFFVSRHDCLNSLQTYALATRSGGSAVERYWVNSPKEG